MILRAYSKLKEEHEVHLKLVLETLTKEKLYAKVSKSDVVGDALSRKEKVKSRRVRGMILATQSKAFKQENVIAERLHGLDQQMERKGDEKIRESSLTGLELVQEMADKVVLMKEMLKAERDHQKSYEDKRRKPLEFEVGDRVLLRVSSWKGVSRFRKKGKLAPRYVGPFEIHERIGLCLADANLHVPLDEIKVNKTLHFVEEPEEIMDQEIRKLKRWNIELVKVRWNSKRGPGFT
ncbi:hypothetical protein Tco_0366015 [Tanacetum coccineum]